MATCLLRDTVQVYLYNIIRLRGPVFKPCKYLYLAGLAQCSELCWQLRGMASKRQVPNAKIALQHNIGLGGAVVVALYRLGFPKEAR